MDTMTSDALAPISRISLVFLVLSIVSQECAAQLEEGKALVRDSVIAAAREIIDTQKYCALVTVDSSGCPHARTMTPFPPEEDMAVWIATNSRSRKVQEIKNNPQVCLYYADHNAATGSVAITGKAFLVDDKNEKEKRKRKYWDQAFPDWTYLILIKVVPEKLEVLNYKRSMVNAPVTWAMPSVEFMHP